MTVVDLESILAPISADDACGPNLEYDPAFVELERLSLGKPERQKGSEIEPAEEPEWPAVRKAAVALLARSKDLRVATHLAKALLRTAGWPGFAAGLAILRGLVDRQWSGVHPVLDPDDGNDATMRVNVLSGIADGAVLTALRAAPLVSSRTIGRIALRDVEAAADASPSSDAGASLTPTLDAAIADCDLAALEEITSAVRGCQDSLSGLEAGLAEQLGSEAAPDFGRLAVPIRRAAVFLGGALSRRTPTSSVAIASDSLGIPALAPSGAGFGGISSRDDVLRVLDGICAYYARHEPSSPIPMLMERSKRLVTMNFVDIVKELVPDALNQIEALRGRNS